MFDSNYHWQNENACPVHSYIEKPILEFMPKKNGMRILDLGCGNGHLAGLLASLGHEVTGIDDSNQGIVIAGKAHPKVRFLCLSVYDQEIERQIGDGYDVVVSSEVIEHLVAPRILLRNARKLLKPDGELILTTVYHGYLKNLALAAAGGMDDHFTALWDGGHIKFFSVKTLTQMVADEGFEQIRFKFAGRLPFLWKSMILSAKRLS